MAEAKPSTFANLFPSSRNGGEGSMTIKLLSMIAAVVVGGEQIGLDADQTLMISQAAAIALTGRVVADIVRAFRR